MKSGKQSYQDKAEVLKENCLLGGTALLNCKRQFKEVLRAIYILLLTPLIQQGFQTFYLSQKRILLSNNEAQIQHSIPEDIITNKCFEQRSENSMSSSLRHYMKRVLGVLHRDYYNRIGIRKKSHLIVIFVNK